MGKGRRLKVARASETQDEACTMVWVDACEIDHDGSLLTIRAGSMADPQVLVAIPAHAARSLPEVLHEASLHAEETYWDVVGPLVGGVTAAGGDAGAVNAAVGRWVLDQGWSSAGSPLGSDEMLRVVTLAGFVGLLVEPPFTWERTLAIFDPMQLRRLDAGLRSALAEALPVESPASRSEGVADALLRLWKLPWITSGRADPTPDEARAEMRSARIEFLRRAPRVL